MLAGSDARGLLLVLVLLLPLYWVSFHLVLRRMDRARIRQDVEARGGRLVRIRRDGDWTCGFPDGSSRSDSVDDTDASGAPRRGRGLTQARTVVFWRDDDPAESPEFPREFP